MAKERMITRTVETKEVEVMTVNTETAEVKVDVIVVGVDYNKATDTLKYLRKHYETETLKIVSVIKETVSTNLYGMSEQEFIRLATVLPDRQ